MWTLDLAIRNTLVNSRRKVIVEWWHHRTNFVFSLYSTNCWLFGCYSDHAVREFSIQIEIFVDMISCFMPLPVYCYFSQNKPVFFSLQKNKLNNINYVFQTGTENKNFTQLCISAKVWKCKNQLAHFYLLFVFIFIQGESSTTWQRKTEMILLM